MAITLMEEQVAPRASFTDSLFANPAPNVLQDTDDPSVLLPPKPGAGSRLLLDGPNDDPDEREATQSETGMGEKWLNPSPTA